MAYRLVRWLGRRLLLAFYRRYGIAHAERVPATGPLLVAANHHGSLVDPLFLIAALERRLRPLAKAPLFSSPVVAPFLRTLGALPVFRPQDRHLVRGDNRELLADCVRALGAGDAILIFPEGLSKAAPMLSSFRPGAARMALEAEAAAGWSLGVLLLPVGIHYDQAGWFRRGRVFGRVGEPIAAVRYRDAWEADRDAAQTALTGELETAIRALIAEVAGSEELRLLRSALRAWAQERGARLDDPQEAELAARFARGWQRLLAETPEQALALRHLVEDWVSSLEHAGLRGDEIDRDRRLSGVSRFLLGDVPVLLLGAPLGLLGLALNWLPFRLVGIAAGRLSEGEDAWASLKLGAAIVLFPLCWLLLALTAALLLSPPWGLAVFLAAPPAGVFALEFRDRWLALSHATHAFLLLAGPSGLSRHLTRTRRAIHDHIEALRPRFGIGAQP